MSLEREILDNDIILKVLHYGSTVWQKTDKEKGDRYTIKILYSGQNYIFYKDGSEFSITLLEGAVPDFSDLPDPKDLH